MEQLLNYQSHAFVRDISVFINWDVQNVILRHDMTIPFRKEFVQFKITTSDNSKQIKIFKNVVKAL